MFYDAIKRHTWQVRAWAVRRMPGLVTRHPHSVPGPGAPEHVSVDPTAYMKNATEFNI
jgi:hypothetical protein